MGKILVIDNYDSFVYTIVGYLEKLGAQTQVVRNDEVPNLKDIDDLAGVLISPGPGNPKGAGSSLDVIAECAEEQIPLLGVCLGHQALAEAFGATVTHAPELMHGKTSTIEHNGTGVFKDIPSPYTATRYHSLAVLEHTIAKDQLEITAYVQGNAGRIVMGLAHKTLPLHGVQFHPESVLTEYGHQLLGNWLELCGISGAAQAAQKYGAKVETQS